MGLRTNSGVCPSLGGALICRVRAQLLRIVVLMISFLIDCARLTRNCFFQVVYFSAFVMELWWLVEADSKFIRTHVADCKIFFSGLELLNVLAGERREKCSCNMSRLSNKQRGQAFVLQLTLSSPHIEEMSEFHFLDTKRGRWRSLLKPTRVRFAANRYAPFPPAPRKRVCLSFFLRILRSQPEFPSFLRCNKVRASPLIYSLPNRGDAFSNRNVESMAPSLPTTIQGKERAVAVSIQNTSA